MGIGTGVGTCVGWSERVGSKVGRDEGGSVGAGEGGTVQESANWKSPKSSMPPTASTSSQYDPGV